MKKRMVTRTISTTEAVVMCLDITTGVASNVSVTLPDVYKDEKKMLNAADKALSTDTLKVVHIVSHTVNDKLYGMLESDFLDHAHVLPPRTKADSEAEGEDNDEQDEDVTYPPVNG